MVAQAFNKHWEEEAGDLMISRPVWTTFFHFGGWGSRQGFSGVCPGTHSIDRPGWPHSWRSTCVCLLIAKELKACTTISILLLNVLNSKQENVTLNILYLKLSRCGMLTKAVKYIKTFGKSKIENLMKRWCKMLYTIMLAGSLSVLVWVGPENVFQTSYWVKCESRLESSCLSFLFITMGSHRR